MRPYPDHRGHICQVPVTPPAVDHHRARRIVPGQGAAAGKIVNLVTGVAINMFRMHLTAFRRKRNVILANAIEGI